MTQLLKLLTANRQTRPKAQSRIEAAADETAIYLYDTIVSDDLSAEYFGGVSAQSIVPQIRAIKGGTIRLHINSAGGDVFAGQAIAQAVRDTGAKVIVQIDGLAASAATLPAMAADQVEIAEGGFLMIHNAWTVAIGNTNDLMETAALLEKVDGSIAAAYSRRSKLKMDEVRKMMNAETWFTAQEALAAGLVDGISKNKAARAHWDLSAYAHAPKEAIEASVEAETDIDEHRERQQQRLRLMTRVGIS